MLMFNRFVATLVVTVIVGVAIVFYYFEDLSLSYLN